MVFYHALFSLLYDFYSWIKQFIDEGGMQVIASELGRIHKKPDRCVATQNLCLAIL